MSNNNDDIDYKELRTNNDDNPMLRFDALMAGVKNGGLRSVSTINLLVCYIVASFEGKIKADTITAALDEGELANHFEVADSIGRMIKSGVICENEDGTLSLGDTKGAPIELIEKDLPLSVRDESMRICHKILARERFERENKVEINEAKGGYNVVMHVSDKDSDFMVLSLFVATIEQAEVIRDKFLNNPVCVYETVVESIFDNE
ncbi:MAG: DUF4364 family protein [Eubacterium sp.]|nr:DUF4364 family protein [Eubacterium sp.]